MTPFAHALNSGSFKSAAFSSGSFSLDVLRNKTDQSNKTHQTKWLKSSQHLESHGANLSADACMRLLNAYEWNKTCRGTVISVLHSKSELIRAFNFWGIRESMQNILPPGSPWSKLLADLIVMPEEREGEKQKKLVTDSGIMFMFNLMDSSYIMSENILPLFQLCPVDFSRKQQSGLMRRGLINFPH